MKDGDDGDLVGDCEEGSRGMDDGIGADCGLDVIASAGDGVLRTTTTWGVKDGINEGRVDGELEGWTDGAIEGRDDGEDVGDGDSV